MLCYVCGPMTDICHWPRTCCVRARMLACVLWLREHCACSRRLASCSLASEMCSRTWGFLLLQSLHVFRRAVRVSSVCVCLPHFLCGAILAVLAVCPRLLSRALAAALLTFSCAFAFILFCVLLAFAFLSNTSLFPPRRPGHPVAHERSCCYTSATLVPCPGSTSLGWPQSPDIRATRPFACFARIFIFLF
jgi:hypothetical protein